jgi:hypothetical protein
MVTKEEVLQRVLRYNAPAGRTAKAVEKVFAADYPAGTNLVVQFAKEFIGLPYGDDGMRIDKKADCSQFWINVLYYWFGIKDIGSYTEALYGAKRGKHITEKDIKPICIILYKLSNRNKHATHAAGYLGGGLMGDTRSKLNPFKVRSWNWKKDKITAIVDFLTEEQRASVTVGGIQQPETKENLPMLKIGSEGAAVIRLQTLLNANSAALKVDGEFGAKTLAAVEKYQQEHGLEKDGIVGPITWGKLIK